MNSNVDVLKELEVKNREIYLHKLVVDLENNYDILTITFENMKSLFTEEVITKICEIECSNLNKNQISTYVTAFQNKFHEYLISLINNKKERLIILTSEIDSIDYIEKIKEETEIIFSKIKEFCDQNIALLCKKVSNRMAENDKNRLIVYLKECYIEKLLLKVKEVFNNTDVILCNNFNESYQKFLDINAKTLK